jgi:hypothetical protein
MKYVIFDLDGCIADDRRRQPLINMEAPDPWEAYHADCEKDPLINGHLIQLASPFHLIVFTARPQNVRSKTERWLRDVAKLDALYIFMRQDECRKSSPELKEDYLLSLFKYGIAPESIVCAYDDRQDVLAMYEKHGIVSHKISYPLGVHAHA